MYTLGKVNGKFCYKWKKHSCRNDLSPEALKLVIATFLKEPKSQSELRNLQVKTVTGGGVGILLTQLLSLFQTHSRIEAVE